jgi:hypothetical protein
MNIIKRKTLDYLKFDAQERFRNNNKGRYNVNNSLYDNQKIIRMIEGINFTTDVNKEIEQCLSPYGTFYDGYEFYIKDFDYYNYSNQQVAQIICCEIFNTLQDYYAKTRFGNGAKEKTRAFTLTLMYHIGLISEQLWYAQSIRNYNYIQKINDQYPNNNIISFVPNKKVSNYLINLAVFNDDNNRLGIVNSKESYPNSDVLEVKFTPKLFTITKSSGLNIIKRGQSGFSGKLSPYTLYLIKKGNKYKKTTARKKRSKGIFRF